jgi:hypothetical protein
MSAHVHIYTLHHCARKSCRRVSGMPSHRLMHMYMFLVEWAYMSIRCVREVGSKHADEEQMDHDHTLSSDRSTLFEGTRLV